MNIKYTNIIRLATTLAAVIPVLGFAQSATGTVESLPALKASVQPVKDTWKDVEGQCGASLQVDLETQLQKTNESLLAIPGLPDDRLLEARSSRDRWYPALKTHYEKFLQDTLVSSIKEIEGLQFHAQHTALAATGEIHQTSQKGWNGSELAKTGTNSQSRFAVAAESMRAAARQAKGGSEAALALNEEATAAKNESVTQQQKLQPLVADIAAKQTQCSQALNGFIERLDANKNAFNDYLVDANTEAFDFDRQSKISSVTIVNAAQAINGSSATAPANPESAKGSGLSTGQVVGIGVGALAVGGVAGYFLGKGSGKSDSKKSEAAPSAPQSAPVANATQNPATPVADSSQTTQSRSSQPPPAIVASSVKPVGPTTVTNKSIATRAPSRIAQKHRTRVMSDSLLD